MEVICTRMAAKVPMPPPSATPAMIHSQPRTPVPTRVATIAMSMPIAAIPLPRAAVRAEPSIFRPTMNRTAESR